MSGQPRTAEPATDTKRLATLRARLALENFDLVELPGDGFIVKRWNWTQHCSSLAEVEQFVDRVELMG